MRKTEGRIFKRGKFYCVQFYVNGKEIRRKLYDENHEGITNYDQALAAREKELKDVRARNAADRARDTAEAAGNMEIIAKNAEMEMQKRHEADEQARLDRMALKINEAWDYFTSPDNRLAPECSDANLKNYHGYWRRFTAWLKEQPEKTEYMRDVTEPLAKRFFGHLEKELRASDNTVNKYRAFLISFFKAMEKEIRGTGNPFGCIRHKKKVKTEKRRDLSMEELKAVLSGADGELGLLLRIGAATGLRLGDAVTLQWHMIDLRNGVIRNTNRKTGAEVVIGIVKELHHIFAAMPENQRTGYLMPDLAAQYLDPKTQPHLVERIQRYFQSCGIQTCKAGTGAGTGKRAVTEVGFHSLRHTFATLSGDQGVAEAVIQKTLGHSNIGQTLYYQHSTVNGAKTAAGQLDGVFSGLLGNAEATLPDPEQEERDNLKKLVDTMSIEQIREILESYGK